MKAKISIVIPIYNSEETLHKCVNSVLAQSYSDFEVILINDGSSDNSGIICEYFSQKDPRISVYNTRGGGK